MLSKKLFLTSILLIVLASCPLIGSVGASSEMWSQTYGGTSNDAAKAMIQTSDGGYALAGYTRSFGAGSYDFWLVKTDEYGDVEWNQTYGGASIEVAYSLVETSDGGYAIAGTKNDDFWLAKTDEHGIIPEFPSWTIIPLLFIASFAAIICKQRLLRKSANN